jgi:hypothetical protein
MEVTFTEADVQRVADAVNFFYKSASFGECDAVKAGTITRHFSALGQHVKFMESKLMELKEVTAKPEKKASK